MIYFSQFNTHKSHKDWQLGHMWLYSSVDYSTLFHFLRIIRGVEQQQVLLYYEMHCIQFPRHYADNGES